MTIQADSENDLSGHNGGVTRRDLLGRSLTISAAAGAGALLVAGCGSSGSSSSARSGGSSTSAGTSSGASGLLPGAVSALPGGTPVNGGTLTVGSTTGASEENLFPGTCGLLPDMTRDYALFSPLFFMNAGPQMTPLVPGLALSAEPNANATLWTFKLRPGVTWHNGKDFGADDVVYNLQTWMANPKTNYAGPLLVGLVDFKNVKATDKLTVQVPLLRSYAQFPELFPFYNLLITQAGMTPKEINKNPIGTGPFKYESFTPGSQSVFVKNDNYWETGKPYFDRLVVNSSFQDDTARINALLSGEIDLVPEASWSIAHGQLQNSQVVVLQSAAPADQNVITMRVDTGPFVDNRIRLGMKYMLDRQALINGSLSGFGSVAYDLVGPATQYYATDLKREQDVERAKSLFKAAGVLGKTFVLLTTTGGGEDSGAAIFAQQASVAGINISIKTIPPSTYFTAAAGQYTRPYSFDNYTPFAGISGQYQGTLVIGCPFRDVWWGYQANGGAAANKLILEAMGTVDETKAADLWHAVQEQQFTEGGVLAYANIPWVDVVAKNLRGLQETPGIPLNMFRMQDGWRA